MMNIDVKALARKSVQSLLPYSSARDDFQGQASVFLDANENPYPSPLNRYPDPHQRDLKNEISRIKNIDQLNIFLGNGSDEPIDLLYRAFCEPGKDEVIIPQPTYGMYAVSAAINDVTVRAPLLTGSFDLDVSSILKEIRSNTKLIFLCSPNNPSGNLLHADSIKKLLDTFPGIVVVDEAYIDFSSSKSWVNELAKNENLVVLQTFSKAWGLAGLRLGMCFADTRIIALLNKIKPPYNIGTLTQIEAIKKLRHGGKVMENEVREILGQRELLSSQLRASPNVLTVFPSDANFVLVKMIDPMSAYARLAAQGIIVRDRSSAPGCEGCLRITIGTKEENAKLIKAMESL